MPKLKLATAAHSANPAKKRKRNQRQDPIGARRSRNAIRSLNNEFVWTTQKEGNVTNNVTPTPIDDFVKKIQKGDTKSNNVTRKFIEGFVKKIPNVGLQNSNVTP